MRLKQLIFVIFCFSLHTYSQQIQLSNDAEISVLTVGSGTSLNDVFGHSAFRIKDKPNGIDHIYGYGQYDFESPNFYLEFAKGRLNYLMSKTNFSNFYAFYKHYNRSISEQVLNLNQTQKQYLYNYLITNYQPKNRAYLYDYFYDNCATKIKDVTEIGIGKPIKFKTPNDFKPQSFRALIHEQAGINNWGVFGIDIALGSVIDQKVTSEAYLFLPKYVHLFFEDAKIDNQTPLVKNTIEIYKKKTSNPNLLDLLLSPLVICSLFATLIIFMSFKDLKKRQRSKWMDILLFSLTGIAGIVIFLLWFATDHTAAAYNYNLLWAFPINIFVIGQLIKSKPKPWFKNYIKFLIILLCLMTLHWGVGIQIFAISLIPLLIALLIRYVSILKLMN